MGKFFEIRVHYIVKDGTECMILLPQPAGIDFKCVLPHLLWGIFYCLIAVALGSESLSSL